MLMIGLILYAVLGLALGLSGINVIDKPIEFIAIMALVAMIDLRGSM
jgi:hypothetical protein